MDELAIAELKDAILKFLQKTGIGTDLDVIKKDLHLYSLPKGIVKACAEAMDMDEVIKLHSTDGDDGFLVLLDKGHMLLASGGYTKPIQEKLKQRQQKDADEQKTRELTDLNIKNLKRAKSFSITAIIISILALIVSVLNFLK